MAATKSSNRDLMLAIARYIGEHVDETLSLERLAKQALMSAAHFQRQFKTVLGVSPKAYQDALRVERFKGELRAGRSVLESMSSAGFGSTSRVYAHARNLGMTPSSYRAGGLGETISYACRTTALGKIIMAATDRGICFVQFGTSEAELVAQLRAEFPRATIGESPMTCSPDLDRWIDALEAHLAGDTPHPALPVDLRGTAFQIQVWRFLLQVREGDVVSYSEIARAIGEPNACRAVAQACARNRIAVLVPCHRVLRADGDVGGYRWGPDRKRALLASERRRATGD